MYLIYSYSLPRYLKEAQGASAISSTQGNLCEITVLMVTIFLKTHTKLVADLKDFPYFRQC